MSDKTALGDRMKAYELSTRTVLPRRTYTIIRVDGKAFHSYLRGAEKPYDWVFMEDMQHVALELCSNITGARFAYVQSDEISILVTDFSSLSTEPWFGGVLQKISSVSASIATAALCARRQGSPVFDGRVFTISSSVEVANYFVWRQQDATRNSISMAAQAQFSHKSLQGLNTSQMQERLWQEKQINWNDYPAEARRGAVATREMLYEDVTYFDRHAGKNVTEHDVLRSKWVTSAAPLFRSSDDSWLANTIPPLPSFTERKTDAVSSPSPK